MKDLRLSTYAMAIASLSISCVDENPLTTRESASQTSINRKTIERPIGGLSDKPGGEVLTYPTIIHETYIPEYDLWDNTRCQAWRIEWPVYGEDVSYDAIPTVFSTNDGALNSFDYLNSVDASNTHNAQFSLYFEQKVESVEGMWEKLDHAFDFANTDAVSFKKYDIDESNIEHWVTERPSLFEEYWEASNETEMVYATGDFILFKNSDQNRYGAIRIVSVIPRVIEVYMAEPNL